jgi:organic radical activating enzyme
MSVEIPHLDFHVTHVCNLSCDGCGHYSNQGHKGIININEVEFMFSNWHNKIIPKNLVLLGGEPTINPNLCEIILIARKYWPDTFINLTTNGFFLHRHPELPKIIKNIGNSGITMSIHHDSIEYIKKIQPILDLVENWKINYNITIEIINSYGSWQQRYLGNGKSMKPFIDNDPRKSWEICPAKGARQLFENKIWKCGPIAYLQLQNRIHNLPDIWDSYLKYKPLELNCTQEELEDFFNKEEEHVCSMCPSNIIFIKTRNPIKNFQSKIKSI